MPKHLKKKFKKSAYGAAGRCRPPPPQASPKISGHTIRIEAKTRNHRTRISVCENQRTSLTVHYKVSGPHVNNSSLARDVVVLHLAQSFPQQHRRYPGNWAEFRTADVGCGIGRQPGGKRRATLANNSPPTHVHTSIIDGHASVKFIFIFHTPINPPFMLGIPKTYTIKPPI